ncbi:MAG TPA: hypothetical protein VK590_10710 [Saprospiraceae bacterium]|nr:hypothetical protein [Saprospiraceae bacterium]
MSEYTDIRILEDIAEVMDKRTLNSYEKLAKIAVLIEYWYSTLREENRKRK